VWKTVQFKTKFKLILNVTAKDTKDFIDLFKFKVFQKSAKKKYLIF
jgi:hypothetical protein